MITSGSPESRIASLERAVAQLQRQAAVRESQLQQRTRTRLAKTLDNGSYPDSSANTFPIVFVDVDFTEAAGDQEITITDHHDEAQVFARSLGGSYIGPDRLVLVLESLGKKRRHVILAEVGGASRALAKLTSAMCPDDECATVECITGDCDAPTSVCNKLKLAGQTGDIVVIEKFTPCESVCDDYEECQIAGCESTEDEYGDESCGAPDDPCEPFWVITQVEHHTFCPLVDTDLRTPEGAYGLDEGKFLVQGRAAISAMYCAEDVVGEIVGNVCCEESGEESSCLPNLDLDFDFQEAANCDEGPDAECCEEEREGEKIPAKLFVTATITNFILGTQVSSQSFEINYNRTLRKWSGSPTICGTTWEIHLWLADSPEEYVCEMVPDPFQGVGEANCFALQSFCSSYDDAINAMVVPDSDSTCSPLVLTFVHAIATCAGCENSDQLTITFTVMEIEP